MCRHLLGYLEPAAVLEIARHSGRPEGVALDFHPDADGGSSPRRPTATGVAVSSPERPRIELNSGPCGPGRWLVTRWEYHIENFLGITSSPACSCYSDIYEMASRLISAAKFGGPISDEKSALLCRILAVSIKRGSGLSELSREHQLNAEV